MIWHFSIRQFRSAIAAGHDERRAAPRTRLLLSRLFLLLTFGALAGCASSTGIRVPQAATVVATENAFALPPPGGPAIVNIVQHEFSNAVQQDIYLYTSASVPGQNVLNITFYGPVGSQYDDRKDLGYVSLRDSDIDRQMRRAIPGVAMARSPYYVQNNFGPFGYAVGKRGGDTCLYAWQQIRSSANAQAAFVNRGTVQVRLRLCDAHATEQQLLRVAYGYTITGTFTQGGWNPYDGAPKVDSSLGRTGNPIYANHPADGRGLMPAPYQMLNTTGGAVPARRPAARTRAPAVTPAPKAVGPIVPSPVSTDARPAASGTVVVPPPNCTGSSAGGSAC
jgi:hypothetical protein